MLSYIIVSISNRSINMNSFYTLLLLLIISSCQSQTTSAPNDPPPNQKVGGPCEGCEAVMEFGNQPLTSIDTFPLFIETEPKLKVSGIIYQKDGKTPASNVILYAYHTNRKGIYETKGNESGWARQHGFIRGWVKTGNDGSYTFYTFRPAAYPSGTEPEHIHMTVKEPGVNEYYIDNILFLDDPTLTKEFKSKQPNRGGSAIVNPELRDSIWEIKRDIVLGLNIPEYR